MGQGRATYAGHARIDVAATEDVSGHTIYVKPNKQNEGLLAFSFSHYIYPRFILNKVRACILSLARLLPRATGYATGPDVDRAVDLCLPRYVWLIV